MPRYRHLLTHINEPPCIEVKLAHCTSKRCPKRIRIDLPTLICMSNALSCPLVNIPSPHSPLFNAQICALKRSKIVAGWVAAGSAWKLYHVPQTPLAGQGRGKVKRKEENEWSRNEGKIRFVGFRWTDDGRHDWDCVQSRACSNQFIIATSRVANTPLKYHILRHSLVTSRTHCKYFK